MIPGIHLLNLNNQEISTLTELVKIQKESNNLRFKITEVTDQHVVIKTIQGYCIDAHANQKTLIALTKALFNEYVKGRKVHVRAILYAQK